MKFENEISKLSDTNNELKKIMSVSSYKIGKYTFDVQLRILSIDNETKKLTVKESYLLGLFAANPEKLLDRAYILKTVWDDEAFASSRSMDVFICKIRKLLSKDEGINIINFHGQGYKMIIR